MKRLWYNRPKEGPTKWEDTLRSAHCKGKVGRQLFYKIKNIFFSMNFVLFILIGIFNTFNGTLISYFLSLFLQPNLAFIVGYIVSLCVAYVLNSVFNFKKRMSLQSLIKFFISYIPNFIIQNITVIIVYNILDWDELIAYVLAAGIGIPVTYLFLKFFAFSSKEKGSYNNL